MKLPFPIICLLLAASTVQASESASQARFSVDARLDAAVPASYDGRYSVRASARLAATDDQRFQLKSTAASCDPSGSDAVFSNGFEGP